MTPIKTRTDDLGKRLDIFIAESSQISRSFAQQLIQQGSVLVNNKPEINKYKIRATDKISIDDSKLSTIVPEISLPVIYEDKDCLVINKPVGVLSHSKGAFNPEATVASFISSKLIDIPSSDRAGIVHRLDRATSGIMICAKTLQAQNWIQKQFSQRKVKKSYLAIIKAGLTPQEAIIDMPIERNPKNPKLFWVNTTGKPAQTKYKILEHNESYALIKLMPTTGRTHQLRVHLSQLKYPIVGDELYGGVTADRLMLHAKNLELTLPNKTRQTFEASTPELFNNYTK